RIAKRRRLGGSGDDLDAGCGGEATAEVAVARAAAEHLQPRAGSAGLGGDLGDSAREIRGDAVEDAFRDGPRRPIADRRARRRLGEPDQFVVSELASLVAPGL